MPAAISSAGGGAKRAARPPPPRPPRRGRPPPLAPPSRPLVPAPRTGLSRSALQGGAREGVLGEGGVEFHVAEEVFADELALGPAQDRADLKPGLAIDIQGQLGDGILLGFAVARAPQYPAGAVAHLRDAPG